MIAQAAAGWARRSLLVPDAATTVQIGPIMQVTRLENEMACAIFELDWFTYVMDAGNNVRAAF